MSSVINDLTVINADHNRHFCKECRSRWDGLCNKPSHLDLHYGKCPKTLNTLFHTIWAEISFFMQRFLKILCGMTNGADPDQTAPSGAVWSGSTLFAYVIFSNTLVFKILQLRYLPFWPIFMTDTLMCKNVRVQILRRMGPFQKLSGERTNRILILNHSFFFFPN